MQHYTRATSGHCRQQPLRRMIEIETRIQQGHRLKYIMWKSQPGKITARFLRVVFLDFVVFFCCSQCATTNAFKLPH